MDTCGQKRKRRTRLFWNSMSPQGKFWKKPIGLGSETVGQGSPHCIFMIGLCSGMDTGQNTNETPTTRGTLRKSPGVTDRASMRIS